MLAPDLSTCFVRLHGTSRWDCIRAGGMCPVSINQRTVKKAMCEMEVAERFAESSASRNAARSRYEGPHSKEKLSHDSNNMQVVAAMQQRGPSSCVEHGEMVWGVDMNPMERIWFPDRGKSFTLRQTASGITR
jgi:hypothetical protein